MLPETKELRLPAGVREDAGPSSRSPACPNRGADPRPGRGPLHGPKVALLVLVTLATLAVSGQAGPRAGALVEELQAAYLFNFTKFVFWPKAAFPASGDPLRIGVVDDASLLEALRVIVAGKSAQGHTIRAESFTGSSKELPHVVFFGASTDPQRVEDLLAPLKDRPVLTVGVETRFVEAGGIIGFHVEGDKLRFSISPSHAARAGLEVSSKLLGLARLVQ